MDRNNVGNLRRRMLDEAHDAALLDKRVQTAVNAEIRELFPELADKPFDDIKKSLEGTFTYQQMQIRHNLNAIVSVTVLPLATRMLACINRVLQRFSQQSETDDHKSKPDSES
jgi:hypothetical protein